MKGLLSGSCGARSTESGGRSGTPAVLAGEAALRAVLPRGAVVVEVVHPEHVRHGSGVVVATERVDAVEVHGNLEKAREASQEDT